MSNMSTHLLLSLQITLRDDGTILSSSCECPVGDFKCSHAATLCIFAMRELSATDVECQWKKAVVKPQTLPMSELYPQEDETYNPLARDITEEDVDWFRSALCGVQCGMTWLLSPEPQHQPQQQALPTVPQLVREFKGQGMERVLAALQLTEEQRLAIQTATVGQRSNTEWHRHRQGRLTASNFGAVLSRRSASPAPSLLRRLLEGQNLDGVLSVNWGVTNEQEGVKAFKQAYQVEVLDCGLCVSQSGILGASPDGFVGTSALLEVKCPYSHRNSTIAEAVKVSSFCLCVEGEGYALKKNHPYWHQVQGQLHLAERDLCFFVVWTTKEAVIIPIPKDPVWGQHLAALEEFYRQHILPVLVSRED